VEHKRTDFAESIATTLAAQGLIKENEVEALYDAFHRSSYDAFEFFLIDERIVEKSDLLEALSKYYQVPAFDVVGHFFQHLLVLTFPEEFLKRYCMIPLEVDENGTLVLVVGNPNNTDLLDVIGDYVSYDISFYVGFPLDILDAIEEFYAQPITHDAVVEDNDIYNNPDIVQEEKMLQQGDFELTMVDLDSLSDEDKLI
jgi:hypothetical protein